MTSKDSDFEMQDQETLSVELIKAQYGMKETRGKSNAKSLLILVNGIELAGKGEAVKQLREWVDPRYLRVKADKPFLLDQHKTFWQPYANFMPAEGQILVMFGNWYSDLLTTASHVTKPFDSTLFDEYVENMRAYEQDLKNNNVDIIKVWFDLSWKSLQKRLNEMDPSEVHWHKLHGLDWRNKKQYDGLQRLRQRFTDDWIMIDCEDAKIRDQQFAQHILRKLKHLPEHQSKAKGKWKAAVVPESLTHIENPEIDNAAYKAELKQLTRRVSKALRFDDRNVVIVFEGMDAAGKGGSIKRIVKKLDPREYQIHTIGAPEKYELARPYLWRFWTKLQPEDKITIFDRSWYGRILVERIEGFANDAEWQRAYNEINRFEKDMTNSQTVIIKFWLAISLDEQEQRFKSREETPHKHFKITPDDWRNRSHWNEYLQAAADIFERTSTDYAPWHIIATDNKKLARLQILRTILKQLKAE